MLVPVRISVPIEASAAEPSTSQLIDSPSGLAVDTHPPASGFVAAFHRVFLLTKSCTQLPIIAASEIISTHAIHLGSIMHTHHDPA